MEGSSITSWAIPFICGGVVNRNGTLAVTGLGVTTGMSKPIVEALLRGYAEAVSTVGRDPREQTHVHVVCVCRILCLQDAGKDF